MFEELMHSIWEEFFQTRLQRRDRIRRTRWDGKIRQRWLRSRYRTRPASARLLGRDDGRHSPRHSNRSPAGGQHPRAAGGSADLAASPVARQRRRREWSRPWSKTSTTSRPQRPLLVRLGQEVQEVPRRLRAQWHDSDKVREFIRAFNERDLDAFVSALEPGVELHSMKGFLKGHRGGAAVGDPQAGRGAADDRARAAV